VILIDALYINTGGSKVILDTILNKITRKNKIQNYFFLFDKRLASNSYSFIEKNNYEIIDSNLISRKIFYIQNQSIFKKIICIANVPPPILIKNKPVYILFHNAHIIKPNLSNYQLFSLIKYRLKWIYLYLNNNSRYNWIVQTSSMYKLLNRGLFVDKLKIKILPFFNEIIYNNQKDFIPSNEIRFAFIADGQPQKNHLFLLKVWKNLFEKYKINYKLLLTVSDSYPELIKQIEALNKDGINVQNLGMISHIEVLNLYKTINFLIYPSLIESFGLPLIEASILGCDVISINKDYVTDVILPSKTFSVNKISDLVEIIYEIHNGKVFPKTQILVENKINDFMTLIS
jgi:hypothetical protein